VHPDSIILPIAESMVRFVAGDLRQPGAGLLCSDSSVAVGAPAAHLDTIAKSSSTFVSRAVNQGIFAAVDGLKGKPRRFWLQSAARELLPGERVSSCMRRPIPGATSVDVYHSPGDPATGRPASAMLGGVQTCNSVWNCPVCQAKISERRRVELAAGVAAWRERGGQIFLVTLTVQHELGEPLYVPPDGSEGASGVLSDLIQASYDLRSGGTWDRFLKQFMVIGTVRALECTYSERHGWHPHLHLLCFVDACVDVVQFGDRLRDRWLDVVAKTGRYASGYGFDCRSSNDEIAEYVAKWGKEPSWTVSHELTKSASKSARAAGHSPHWLLECYALGDNPEMGELWREYAIAFKGRRQLEWSRGLREKLLPGTRDKSDEELNTEFESDAILLAQLTLAEWRVIVKLDARGELLDLAMLGDALALRRFVDRVMASVVVSKVDRVLRLRGVQDG
jgi:hypothetical protein